VTQIPETVILSALDESRHPLTAAHRPPPPTLPPRKSDNGLALRRRQQKTKIGKTQRSEMGAKQNQNCDKKGEMEKRLRVNAEGGAKWGGSVLVVVCPTQTGDVDIFFYFIHFSAVLCHMKSNFHAWLLLLCVGWLLVSVCVCFRWQNRVETEPKDPEPVFLQSEKCIIILTRKKDSLKHTHTPIHRRTERA